MVSEAVDVGSLGVNVLELVVHLRGFGKITLGLKVILDLIADWPGRAEVPVVSLRLGGFFEATLGFEVVLQGSHDVGASCGLGLERSLRLGLGGQRSGSQSKARGTAEVGAGLATMTEEFHFWCPVVSIPVVGKEGS